MKTGILKSNSTSIALLTRVLDVILVLMSGFFAYYVRFDLVLFRIPLNYAALILIAGLLTAVIFPLLSVYNSWRAQGLWAPVARVFAAWSVVFLILFALLVLAKQGQVFSRLWMALWGLMVAFMLMGLRLAVFSALRVLRERGYNRRRVIVVGDGPAAKDLIQQAFDSGWAGFDVVAVFSDQADFSGVLGELQPCPLSEFDGFIADDNFDEVWIAMPLEQSMRLRGILEALHYSTANVRYAPDLFGLFMLNHGVTEILGNPMIDLTASPMQGFNRLLKALEDRLLAMFILVLASPLMLLIAIAIKLDSPGPVFYRQERLGWGGHIFGMLKFRSMPVDIEEEGIEWGGARSKLTTSFGAFLRRTSLDELPQFINVLRGNMSIVGPRPERPVFVEQFKKEIPGYMQKHMVKAGITGWAQINGWRGDTDLKERIEHDLYYIENWSLGFDLKIIFLTLFRGFMHKNAY